MRRLYLISGHVWAFCAAGWFIISRHFEVPAELWLVCAALALYLWYRAVQF